MRKARDGQTPTPRDAQFHMAYFPKFRRVLFFSFRETVGVWIHMAPWPSGRWCTWGADPANWINSVTGDRAHPFSFSSHDIFLQDAPRIREGREVIILYQLWQMEQETTTTRRGATAKLDGSEIGYLLVVNEEGIARYTNAIRKSQKRTNRKTPTRPLQPIYEHQQCK